MYVLTIAAFLFKKKLENSVFKKLWKIVVYWYNGILLSHEEEQTTDTKRGWIPETFRRIPFVWSRKGRTNPGGPKIGQRLPGAMRVGEDTVTYWGDENVLYFYCGGYIGT